MKSLSLIVALLIGSAVYGGSIPYEFPWVKIAKNTGGQANPDLSAIRLDDDIYRQVNSYMTEMRIVDSEDREVPFTVQKYSRAATSTEIQKIPAIFKKLRQETNRLDIYITPRTSSDAGFSGIELNTDAKNFEKRVTIAVHAGGKWQAIVQSIICDFSDYAPFSRNVIAFPAPVRGTVFRVIIDNVVKESPNAQTIAEITGGNKTSEYLALLHRKANLKLGGINFLTLQSRTSGTSDILAGSKVEITNVESKTEKTVILLQSHRQPLTGFRLGTTSLNFTRHYLLEGMTAADAGQPASQWQPVGSGTISSCDFKTIRKKSLNIDFPEARFSNYRLTIINGNNPPLQQIAIEAGGPIYQMIMIGKQSKDLTVYYGPNKMPPPNYDTDALLTKLSGRSISAYSLSAGQKNPDYQRKWYSGKIIYIVGLLFVLVAGALSWLLFRTMRKADAADEKAADAAPVDGENAK